MDCSESSVNYNLSKDFEEFGSESEVESIPSSKLTNDRLSKLSSNKLLFIEKIREGNNCCQNGDYGRAIKLYTEAINLDPTNHVLYGNRSAAYCRANKYSRALTDAIKARELSPRWSKAYYRQGIALQHLGRTIDALAAFAAGLAQDSKSPQLLARFIETAMKSPLRASLEPIYRQLQAIQLDKSPFVITSLIGQELLSAGHYPAALVILESSLRIGTRSLKLRESVYSALAAGYWALGQAEKAIHFMKQDLEVAKSLGDQLGEARAHGNLGSAHYVQGNFKEALAAYRAQLALAMKSKQTEVAASALTALGHVYTAIGDSINALSSHSQALQMYRSLIDPSSECREIGNVGSVYLTLSEYDKAIECHAEHLKLAKSCRAKFEEAKAYSNLGAAYHAKKDYERAIQMNESLLRLAQELGNSNMEARAYAGFGHAARCLGDLTQAKRWHHRQLEMVLTSKNRLSEGRTLANLGVVYYLLGDYDSSLKLHRESLSIARELNDEAAMQTAYGNISKCYSAINDFDEAIKYRQHEAAISERNNHQNHIHHLSHHQLKQSAPLPASSSSSKSSSASSVSGAIGVIDTAPPIYDDPDLDVKRLSLDFVDDSANLDAIDTQFIPISNLLPQK